MTPPLSSLRTEREGQILFSHPDSTLRDWRGLGQWCLFGPPVGLFPQSLLTLCNVLCWALECGVRLEVGWEAKMDDFYCTSEALADPTSLSKCGLGQL